MHKNRSYVFNADLKDFFPSIHFHRVRGFFLRNKNFQLQPKVATVIAQICCHENSLPQGSPTSPIISNLIGHILDVRLAQLSSVVGCTYSRYADDLTFSTNQNEFPKDIAYLRMGVWCVGSKLTDEIESCGFQLNSAKTRMQHYTSRQTVTGLVVNKRPNVSKEYYRQVRAMTHQLFKSGAFYIPYKNTETLNGRMSIIEILKRLLFGFMKIFYAEKKVSILSYESGSLNVLGGRINHVITVEMEHSKRNRFAAIKSSYIENKKENKSKEGFDIEKIPMRFLVPKGKFELYRKFAFFKNFVRNDFPIVLCEGKTDIIYLKYAIKSRKALFPLLIDQVDGSIKVNFFKSTGRFADVLDLRGGADSYPRFINEYKKMYNKFAFKGDKHAVIIAMDNDSGSNSTYEAVRKSTGLPLSRTHHEDIYNIFENLYFVSTPPVGADGTSFMENLFTPATLATPLGGRIFSTLENYDVTTHYGKVEFAEKVIQANWKITDFSAFDPLLQKMSDAIHSQNAKP